MKNGVYGWTTGLLAVALCALVLLFATPGATAQANNGRDNGLAHRVAALEATVDAQQSMIDQLRADLTTETTARISSDAGTLAAASAYTDGQVAGLTSRIFAVEEKTQFMSVLGSTTLFSGTNVQLVNGTGKTRLINGLGNLIVGYNETVGTFGDERGGSHNMVVGVLHDYLSYGGLVAGAANRIANQYASVPGGGYNVASGPFSTVTGGEFNVASGFSSAVTGGNFNTASHFYSTVSGGASLSTSSTGQWIGGTYRSPP